MERSRDEHSQNQHVECARWKSSIPTHRYPMRHSFAEGKMKVKAPVRARASYHGSFCYRGTVRESVMGDCPPVGFVSRRSERHQVWLLCRWRVLDTARLWQVSTPVRPCGERRPESGP